MCHDCETTESPKCHIHKMDYAHDQMRVLPSPNVQRGGTRHEPRGRPTVAAGTTGNLTPIQLTCAPKKAKRPRTHKLSRWCLLVAAPHPGLSFALPRRTRLQNSGVSAIHSEASFIERVLAELLWCCCCLRGNISGLCCVFSSSSKDPSDVGFNNTRA